LKLALGTVQFGLKYGIANPHGQVPRDEAKAVLDHAHASGMNVLDTAIDYGDSEQRLGDIGIGGWHVVSKLPAIPADCGECSRWVAESVAGSLRRLRIERLYGLLLHRPQQLLDRGGDQLYAALRSLKVQGVVQNIGVSIYDPAELDPLFERYDFDIVQAPFNVLDRRLIDSGWLPRLAHQGTELHVRSVFLQGLLLMNPGERPERFRRWQSTWTRWDEWLRETGVTPLQACLRYVLRFPEISRIVVGVDSVNQLQEILAAAVGTVPSLPDALGGPNHQDLLNPARWNALA